MKPRVRIINHRTRTRDVEEGGGTTLPWAKRQSFNEALKNLKRAVASVPESVTTSGEAQAAARALSYARQELAMALRLLAEKE